MRKPSRLLTLLVSLPLLSGCFAVLPTPIPATPSAREELDVKGVVLADGDQRVEFDEVLDVSWTTDQVFIVGIEDNESVTRQFPLATLSGVLARQLDTGRTSGVIGGMLVGTVAVISILVTGSDPRSRAITH